MKIAFTGTHSTGKTTLLNELRKEEKFKDYKFFTNVTRDISAMGLPINENGTFNTQKTIMNQIAVNTLLNKDFIADRSVIDVLAYSMYHYQNDEEFTYENVELLEDIYNKVINEYDYLIYLKPHIKLEDDGARSMDLEYQKTIDENIKFLLDKIRKYDRRIKIIEVSGTVEERLNQIIQRISKDIEIDTKAIYSSMGRGLL